MLEEQPFPKLMFHDVGREKDEVFHNFLSLLGDNHKIGVFLRHFPDLMATHTESKRSTFVDLKSQFREDTGNWSVERDSMRTLSALQSLDLEAGYMLSDNDALVFIKTPAFVMSRMYPDRIFESNRHNGNGSGKWFVLISRIENQGNIQSMSELTDYLSSNGDKMKKVDGTLVAYL